jgi:KDO2-lipid IV(A) lauroyltransferase
MNLRHLGEYLLFQAVAFLVQLLPLRFAQRLGSWLGEQAYAVLGFRREVTLDNLRHAFPEKSPKELDRLARASFRVIGKALFELLWMPRLTKDRLNRLFRFENPELVREIHARGKGMLVLTAHFGNWELAAQCFAVQTGIPLNVIVKTQSNPYVDKSINARRVKFGNKIVPMGVSIREVVKALRAGEPVGIVADQSAPKENVAVKFFGRLVPTHQGPAVFSLKMGAPLIATFPLLQPDGSYRARFVEIPTDDLVGLNEKNILELTKRHVRLTEEVIRQYPDHWMWMHRRWKHVLKNGVSVEEGVQT